MDLDDDLIENGKKNLLPYLLTLLTVVCQIYLVYIQEIIKPGAFITNIIAL